mmetsp:Transcript_45135/g.139842  ORF Transcript_45135/g.139842 Transcript_45135/m.139842 type:complete len:268 (+) Transcript_45135:35-838(+)
MAVDSKNLYIADTLNHRIQVFTRRTHELLGCVEIPADCAVGQMQDPSGICCVEDACLAIVEYGLDRVLYLRLEPDTLEVIEVRTLSERHLYGPFGVGHSRGRIIVADSCNHRVLALNLAGQAVLEFGVRGSGPGQFEYPECVAVFSDGHLAISDKDNHRIQVFNASGGFSHFVPNNWAASDGARAASAKETCNGRLRGPMGMCCDRQDRLYICDCGGNRVQIFTRRGQWLWSSLNPGSASTFRSPTALAIDEDGQVYVASDHCVQIF